MKTKEEILGERVKWWNHLGETDTIDYDTAISAMQSFADQQTAALTAEVEGLRKEKWVRVEDGLPEFRQKVLVMGEEYGMNPQMGGAYLCISERVELPKKVDVNIRQYYDKNLFHRMTYVTHWMPINKPLPNPPTK